MKYIPVAKQSDFTATNKKKVTLEDTDILLVKIQDDYYAVNNKCPHMGGSLYDGKLEGTHVVCPRHGSIFDVTNGDVVEAGKILFVTIKVDNVQTYPVKVEGDSILIGIES